VVIAETAVMPRRASWPAWPVDAAVRGHGAPKDRARSCTNVRSPDWCGGRSKTAVADEHG